MRLSYQQLGYTSQQMLKRFYDVSAEGLARKLA
jgi:hypothetical protein